METEKRPQTGTTCIDYPCNLADEEVGRRDSLLGNAGRKLYAPPLGARAAPPSGASSAPDDRSLPQPPVPSYLKDTYTWAYLRPTSVYLLDRLLVVNAILWGNYRLLLRAVLGEIHAGQRVYQPACVYGDFSHQVAEALGPDGHLDVGDVAPVQVENCRRKLRACDNARVHLWDAADECGGTYDVVCCFFLLHEIPESYKRRVVDALLGAVPPGGKVVFVDYHRPHWAHPLKWIMSLINGTLEPFAKALWANEIASYGSRTEEFSWSKQTYFGGLYQKAVAERRPWRCQGNPTRAHAAGFVASPEEKSIRLFQDLT